MANTLEDALQQVVRKKSVLTLEPVTSPLPSIASKFGGLPYLDQGETWPICPGCGDPLSFICQVNLRETVFNFPTPITFFAFYYCRDCFPQNDDAPNEGKWLVKTYTHPDEDKAVPVPWPANASPVKECRISFREALSLPDWKGQMQWCPEAADLAIQRNPDQPWVAYWEAARKLLGPESLGVSSYVGGYPEWIQGAMMPPGAELLAQICSEDKAGLMWGDYGFIYLFVETTPPHHIRMVFQCT